MSRRTKAILSRAAARAGRIAPAAALACSLGACVDVPSYVFAPPRIDPASPIIKDMQAASDAKRPYPKFADIPPGPPTDIRPVSAWSRNIYDTLQLRRQQQALEALYPQTLSGTEAWADAQKARATAPPPPASNATEDYAKAQRDRAKLPSPAS
jgi:hypothetical protein